MHHLRNKGLIFIFFHQNSLNFDHVPGTGSMSKSKISGPGTGLGYNWVPYFRTSPRTNPIESGLYSLDPNWFWVRKRVPDFCAHPYLSVIDVAYNIHSLAKGFNSNYRLSL